MVILFSHTKWQSSTFAWCSNSCEVSFYETDAQCALTTDALCMCTCDFDYAIVVVGLALLCMQKTPAAALQTTGCSSLAT